MILFEDQHRLKESLMSINILFHLPCIAKRINADSRGLNNNYA